MRWPVRITISIRRSLNALGALGKSEALRHLRQGRVCTYIEAHLRQVPEDVRARIMLAIDYSAIGRIELTPHCARSTSQSCCVLDEASVLYNAACAFFFFRWQEARGARRASQGA